MIVCVVEREREKKEKNEAERKDARERERLREKRTRNNIMCYNRVCGKKKERNRVSVRQKVNERDRPREFYSRHRTERRNATNALCRVTIVRRAVLRSCWLCVVVVVYTVRHS